VTARAGLEGRDLDFSFGVAAGDFDNDGFTDLFLCQAGRNALYRNNGDGTFTDVTEKAGLAAKKKDLLSVCAAWLDYDNDGRLDLVVSHYTYWSPQTDLVCTFEGQGEIYCSPTRYQSVPHTLYRNLGGGRFEDVSERSGFAAARNGKGMGIAIADLTTTAGRTSSSPTTRANFYMNRGDGTFARTPRGIDYNDRATVSGWGGRQGYETTAAWTCSQQPDAGWGSSGTRRRFVYASPPRV
jgi:hypothetical protein